MKKKPLKEIAESIAKYLRRFERDPKINVKKHGLPGPYYWANAFVSGRYVSVMYISFQGPNQLTREEAEAYLAWLDAGNVGTHFDIQ